MKARVIFGVSGSILILSIVFFFPPAVFQWSIVALCAISAWELLVPTKQFKNAKIAYFFILATAIHSMLDLIFPHRIMTKEFFTFGVIVASFLLLFSFYHQLQINAMAYGLCVVFLLPKAFYALTDLYVSPKGSFFVFIPLLIAWGADTFAFLCGKLWGKHPLAPTISPNKTIEGAIGGIVGSLVFVFVFKQIVAFFGHVALFSYPVLIVLSIVGSMISQMGDLAFSVIKRQTNIKDYGTIFPGHGGVLDRFDSVVFVAPYVCWVFRYLELLS